MLLLSYGDFLSGLELVFYGLIPALLAFLLFHYFWSLDKRTASFDEDCRKEINEDQSFREIRRGADPEFIITSESRTSKAISELKKITGRVKEGPTKIVVLEEQSEEERKKEIILERCKEIPGKNLINPKLLASIRNYYAYKLSLKTEGENSDVTEHFRSRFEEYEYSNRVNELSKNLHMGILY